jgi:hypothetical protein
MRFDALLESKTLPTYRSAIVKAIESGHQVDLLYHTSKSVCKSEVLDTHPLLMVSLLFAEPRDMGREEVFRNVAATSLPSAEFQPIADGWRLWSASTSEFQLLEVKTNELSLLSSIRLAQTRLYAPLLLLPVVRIFRFSERASRPDFSFLMFMQGLQGRRLTYRNGFDDPNALADDNIVMFDANCSFATLSGIGSRILRGLGHSASNQEIQNAISEAFR